MRPYIDPTTGEWVGEYETRVVDQITRQTEWFATESEARRFARTGKRPEPTFYGGTVSDDDHSVTWLRVDQRHWESEERGDPDTAPLVRAMRGDDDKWRVSISGASSLEGPYPSFTHVRHAVPGLLRGRDTAGKLRELFRDWLRARFYVIGDISTNIAGDYRALIEEAKERADAIGLSWDDDFIPDHVPDTIEALEDPRD